MDSPATQTPGRFARLVPDLEGPIKRLPIAVAVLVAVIAFLAHMQNDVLPFRDSHALPEAEARWQALVFHGGMACFFWAVAVTIRAETYGMTWRLAAAWLASGFAVVIGLAAATFFVSPWIGFHAQTMAQAAALVALLAIAGAGAGRKANARILQSLLAGFAAYLLAVSVALLIESGGARSPDAGQAAYWIGTNALWPVGKVFAFGLWMYLWMMLLRRTRHAILPDGRRH